MEFLTFFSTTVIILCTALLLPLVVLTYLFQQSKKKIAAARRYSTSSELLDHVLITGGSQGIGLCLAKEAARRGATHITLLARNMIRLEDAKDAVEAVLKNPSKQKVSIVSCDVGYDYDTVHKAIQEAENEQGNVTMLINCAGTAIVNYFDELAMNDFKIDINYMGSVYATRAVIADMQRNKHGAIVFVSSQGGQVGFVGMTAYSPTKYALRGFAEALRNEMLPFNISVSVVYPPDTDTPGYAHENISKPVESVEISETAGLLQPEVVAIKTFAEALDGVYSITFGLDGFMLDTVTCGLNPYPGFVRSIAQVCLIGLFRLIGMFYAVSFDQIVQKHADRRKIPRH